MTSDQMHYATYGRSRYRRKNNVNTKATSYEKAARRRVATQNSSGDNIEKKNINRKEMTSSWGQHIRAVAKDDDPPTVVTNDIDNNSSRQHSRHRSASLSIVSSSLRDSYVSSSSSSSPTLQSTSCSGCSGSNQSSHSDSGSSVYSEDDSIYSSDNNGNSEDGSYSSQSYHTSPTIDQDTTSSFYSASIGYKRSLTWNGKTFHPHTNNDNRVSSSFVHKSNHYNELNNSNSKESRRTIAAKKWLGFDVLSKKKNLIAKKKKFSFGSSKHSASDVGNGDEGSMYEENSVEDGSVEEGGSVESGGEGSIYNEESIHSSDDDESQGCSYSTSDEDEESSIGSSNISTTQYESKPSFLRSSMKKIGTTGNQCKRVLSNVKIPMLISGSSCKKMMLKRQSLLHDSYEGSSFDNDEMNLSNYLTKTRKGLEQHQSTIAPNDDGYTDGSMTYCSSLDGRISYDVENGEEDEEGEGKEGDSYISETREENEVCSGSDLYINEEVANEEGDIVADEIKKNDDADDSSSMIQQKLSIEEECIIEELLHENERLYKKIAMLLSEREERASSSTQEMVQSSTSNTLGEKEDDKVLTEEDNDDKQALVLEDKDKDEEDSQVNLLTTDKNDTSSTRLLTDEHVADSHTKCLDEIATLINGIGILPSSSSPCVSMNTKAKDIIKEQKDTMGDEILKLVSKILSQRVIGVSPAPPRSTVDPPQVDDDNDDKTNPPSSEGDCEAVKTSPPRRSSSDCSVTSSAVSPEDRSTSSASTPYIVSKMINEMSSNSLFDSSPSMYQESSKSKERRKQRKFDFEDSESTLEIVYEYYSDWSSDESRGTSSSSSSSSYQRSRYTSASEHVDMPPRGYHRYSPSPSRSRHRSRSRSASKSRCSSSSRYSRSKRSSSSKSRTPKKFKSSSSYRRSKPKSRSTSSGKGNHSKRCASKPGSSRSEDRRSYSPPAENIKASEAKDQKHDTVKADEKQVNSPQTNQAHATSASANERPSTKEDDVVVEVAKREEQLSSAIDNHLKSIQDIMTKQPQVKSKEQHTVPDLSCALSATSDNTSTSRPSLGSQSTRERKGISISMISRRSSRMESSSSETCLTFFIPTLTKKQIDGVLEELLETRETVSSNQVADGANKASKKKKRKYQGEYNEEGQRHGYGIYTSKNGNQYRGEWQHNQREGLGVVKIGQGDVFEGQFKGNLKNGVGVYHYDDGECDLSRYEDDVRVGDTIRYSEDRQHAFLLSSEQGSRRISLEEAVLIAKGMGTIVASKASSPSEPIV